MNNKVFELLLQEAFKSNYIKLGARIIENIKNKKGQLLIISSEIPIKQFELYKNAATKFKMPYLVIPSSINLDNALERVNHNACIIIDSEYANKIQKFVSIQNLNNKNSEYILDNFK